MIEITALVVYRNNSKKNLCEFPNLRETWKKKEKVKP